MIKCEVKADALSLVVGKGSVVLVSEKQFEVAKKFLEILPEVKEEKKPSANETVYYRSKQQKSEDAKRRNRLKAVEQEISDCDVRLAEIEQEMADPETCADYEKMSALCAEMEELKNRQNDLMDEWAELSED